MLISSLLEVYSVTIPAGPPRIKLTKQHINWEQYIGTYFSCQQVIGVCLTQIYILSTPMCLRHSKMCLRHSKIVPDGELT